MARGNVNDRRNKARERARQQVEDNKFSGGNSYLKLPEGMRLIKLEKKTYDFDILPFEIKKKRTVPDTVKREMDFDKGEIWWHRSIFVHRNVGPDKKYILCPRTVGKPCPICEDRKVLMEDWDSNEKTIYALKPQHKDLIYVIDRDNEKEGIGIIEHSYANFREVIEKELREQDKDEYYDFFQLEDGYTLRIRVIEDTYEKNTFYKADRIDFEKRTNYKESVLDETIEFDDLLIILPYEKIQKIHLGLDDEEDQEEEKEPEKAPEKETRTSRRPEPEPEPEPEKSTRSSRRAEPEPDPEPEPEKEPEKETRSRRGREEKKSDSECPFNHDFGAECDKHDDCPDCPKETWEKCADRFDELKAKK